MASESIGALYPTQIPGYADNADIQEAFRLYHYGSAAYNTANTNPASLVNPSVAYTLNSLQDQITSAAGSIATSFVNAKGDLISASANDTPLVLGVGSNGTILSANSATATGLEWIPTSGITSVGTLSSLAVTGNAVYHIAFNTSPTGNYTLVTADDGKIVEMSSGGVLTVPADGGTFVVPVGTQITILQTGTSQVTIVGLTASVVGTPGLKLRAQWSSCVLVKRAANTWVALGDLVA